VGRGRASGEGGETKRDSGGQGQGKGKVGDMLDNND